MSLVHAASMQLRPDKEWGVAQAQAARNAVDQRHGDACIEVDLTIASAAGLIYSWFRAAVDVRSSAASVQWPCVAWKLSAGPSSNQAIGPLHVASGAAAGAPWFIRPSAVAIELLDEGLNLLDSSNPTGPPIASWELMRTEWDTNNNRVRIWLWNAGTSSWDLYIDYTHGSTLGTGPWKFGYGWTNNKAATLNCSGFVQDGFWIDNAGGGPNTKPATPWECYPSFPNGDGTYSAWTGDHNDVDDLEGGADHDGATTEIESGVGGAAIKESHAFPDGIAPGTRPIVGVGFGGYLRKDAAGGTSGDLKHLILADGAEETIAIGGVHGGNHNNYLPYSVVRSRTPAGNPYTPTLVDGAEYGYERDAPSNGTRDARCTATHICVVECELEPPGVGATTMGLAPGVF